MDNNYPRDALKPGHLLLWYKIERVLGEGGFGITYLAHDVNLDKLVAIKEYLPNELCRRNDSNTIEPNTNTLDDFETGLNRFIREARTLAKFEHPNVVKVSNVFEENNTAYMAMAYEKGKDLKDLLKPKKTITEDHILSIIIPVLEGLDYVHETGFIHRDIKPANIMIRQDGSPVLIDFGSVHDTKKSKESVTTLVSPGFTPHEQYVGNPESQGPWSDIYSLGATLYRCIAGVNPVDAITRGSALIKQYDDPLVTASEVGKDRYSEHLLKAIDHALAFDEKNRPQNIRDWHEELVGNILIEKGDTLNEGNYIRTTTSHHYDPKPDKTLDLTKTSKPIQKKNTPPVALISIGILVFLIGITLFSKTEKTQEKQVAFNQEGTSTAKNEKESSGFDEIAIEKVIKEEVKPPKLGNLITDKLSDGSEGPSLVVLPQGSNFIGSDEKEFGRKNDEGPQTLVTIKEDIAIGITEITVADFRKFVDASQYQTQAEKEPNRGCRTYQPSGWDWTPGTSWKNPGYEQEDNHPVVCVSWSDAMAYVKWLSKETGENYQLPSEAIWEYASRAGTITPRFWSDDDKACNYSNVSDFSRASMHGLEISSKNIFPCEDGYTYSSQVATYEPNQYGLYDTIGNVWEWTYDCWNSSYTNVDSNGGPRLDGNCNNRVYRGGAWGNLPTLVRAAKRLTDPSHYRYYNLGFRISRIIKG